MRQFRKRPHWSGGVIAAAVAAVLCAAAGVIVGTAAFSRDSPSHPIGEAGASTNSPSPEQVRAALLASVQLAPGPNASNVLPDAGIVVGSDAGRLTAVKVVGPFGTSVPGTFDYSRHRWWSTATLAQNTSYRITATVAGASGIHVQAASSFHTVVPASTLSATLFPYDGMRLGVGQPIVLHFNQPVVNPQARATLTDHITLSESQPVATGLHWFSPTEVHIRPRSYWPAGEQVTVATHLDDWNAGNGAWGSGDETVHFSIGPAHIATANLASLQMTVTENGRVVAVYPFSGGRPKYPTMNGTHIVMDRESVVRMISSTNGIPVNSPDGYDELVYDDVHISDSGEYVHAAPWSVSDQGHVNVSHGCINLSPANATAFMNFSRVGDIVQVVGGPRPPNLGDHGVMDWDTNWNEWTPITVVGPATARPAPPTQPARLVHATRG